MGRVRSAVSGEQQVLAACACCPAPLLHQGESAPFPAAVQWQQARQPRRVATARLWHQIERAAFVVEALLEKGTFMQTEMCLAVGQLLMLEQELQLHGQASHFCPGGDSTGQGNLRQPVNGRQHLPGSQGVARDGMLVGYSLLYKLSQLVAGGRSRGCPEQACRE